MFVKLMVDELTANKTTESGFFNDRDEAYFTIAGSHSNGQIEIPRVSPPPPEDYYGLKAGQQARNIPLWQGHLNNGDYAYLTVALREQDNAQLGAIVSTVKGTALGIAAIFVDPSLGPAALNALKDAAVQFADSLSTDGDQTIGVFAVRIHIQANNLVIDWLPVRDTVVAGQNGASATLHATGSNARYTVRTHVEQLRAPIIVAKHSGKCLDVVGGSLQDQANVQQYTIHGGDNQRWLLKPFGYAPAHPVSPLLHPVFAFIAQHSGKCLDVVGGSLDDQANVQQYTTHFGENQRWILVPSQEDLIIVNLHSRKVLDVAGGSTADHANVQQFRFHGGLNQRWKLQD